MKKLLLFSMITLLSCTKVGKSVTVKGRFYNPLTGEGIEGVKLILHRNKTFSYEAGTKIYKEAYTDADGNYEVSALSTHNNISFSVKQFPGDYYWIGWVEGGKVLPQSELQIKIGKKKKADYQAVPFSFLKMKINNVNCQGADDTLMLYRHHQIPDTGKDGLWVRTGCAGFETNGHSRIPMGMYYYRWVVIRNGVRTEFKDSIYLQPGQQHTFTINY